MNTDHAGSEPEGQFVADLRQASLKSDIASLEFPFFSLSKSPSRAIQTYERGDVRVEVLPSAKGLPTIWDRGILVYAAAQLVKGMDLGRVPSRVLAITPYDLLKTTNGKGWCGGGDYRSLIDSLDRLRGVTVKTTVCTGGHRSVHGFGFIEEYRFVARQQAARGLTITLCEWLYRALLSREVLTLEPEYFQLKGGLERRLYEIVRKHLGMQRRWSIDLGTLQMKSGSHAPPRRFRFELRGLVDAALKPPLDRYLLAVNANRLQAYPNTEIGRRSRAEDALAAVRSRKPVPAGEQLRLGEWLKESSDPVAPARVIGNAECPRAAGEKL